MPGNFQFYTEQVENGLAEFDEAEWKHAIVSLRYHAGDQISFTDGKGKRFSGRIDEVIKGRFTAVVDRVVDVPKPSELSIACGIIKSSDRQEWMVEKCTELGVASLFFVHCANSERDKVNLDKLQKTAIAAMKQSHGCWLPELRTITWKEAMQLDGNKIIAAISAEEENTNFEKHNLICLIGPEGDFTEAEMEQALQSGYRKFSLGKQILRTETAVIAAAVKFVL